MKSAFAVSFAGSIGCLFRGACGRSAGCRSADLRAGAVTPFNWSGVYFGAQGGYGWGSTAQSFAGGAPSGNSNPQGWLGGRLSRLQLAGE